MRTISFRSLAAASAHAHAHVSAAILLALTIVSCTKDPKELPIPRDENGSLIFTASITSPSPELNQGTRTKTSVDSSTGIVTWEQGDQIKITDKSNTTATYTVSTLSNNNTTATFTKDAGQPDLGDGPYSATFGPETGQPSTTQTYSASPRDLPMSTKAPSPTTALQFEVTCGLLELRLAAPEQITSISITGIPSSTDPNPQETTYTLTCDPEHPVDISNTTTPTSFYIALPAGNYTKITLHGTNGAICKKEQKSQDQGSIQIQTNQINTVTFATALHFSVQLWEGGPYWSTTNLGATSKSDYGTTYYWGNSTATEASTTFTDPATSEWGTDWKTPESSVFKSVVTDNICKFEHVNEASLKGTYIIGDTEGYKDHKIFLPTQGASETKGYYWSSTTDGKNYAYDLEIDCSSISVTYKGIKKTNLCAIRPVRVAAP